MKIAFIIFEGMTALDFIGVYDPIVRLKAMGFVPDLQWDVCAPGEDVHDSHGLRFVPTKVGASLEDYDMVIVPGGTASRELVDDSGFIKWLKTAEHSAIKASVCTGALLLGAAGFLKGKRATTHPKAFQDLRGYCSSVEDQRIVDQGGVITAGGVTSSIDLGLYLCEKLAGRQAREKIRQQMVYSPPAL
jgi:transcriptional regulator GlxA family with amidase domain